MMGLKGWIVFHQVEKLKKCIPNKEIPKSKDANIGKQQVSLVAKS